MDFKNLINRSFLESPMSLLRIWLGIAFIIHGLPGIFSAGYMEGHTAFMELMDFPMPAFLAYLSKGGELIFGILLLLGLFTRFASLGIIINMIVATFFAMRGDIFGDYQAEISFTYLIIALALFLTKPTALSLDDFFWKSELT